MATKIGALVLATDQGLGYLAKSFYDNGIINEVLIHPHGSRKNHYEWYPKACKTEEELFSKIDTLLLFETAWDWKIIVRARKRGIKTVLMPMYECTQNPLPYEPDVVVCPSLLDLQYYQKSNSIFLPVPVDVKWKRRERARVFVHNAGNGGLGGRNGTRELVDAMQYVKSPIKLIIRSQVPLGIKPTDPRIEYRIGQFDDIWSEGDVFIFPEKFNGLSLPLQEAFASGMMVMAGDRFPINTWLPREPLIPVKNYRKERLAVEFDCAVIDPKDIAKAIDNQYNAEISNYSQLGKEWAKQHSWEKLKSEYIEICAK